MTAIYSLFEQTMVLIEQTLNKSEEQLLKDIDAERKLSYFLVDFSTNQSSKNTSGASYQHFSGTFLPRFSSDRGNFVRAAQRGKKN